MSITLNLSPSQACWLLALLQPYCHTHPEIQTVVHELVRQLHDAGFLEDPPPTDNATTDSTQTGPGPSDVADLFWPKLTEHGRYVDVDDPAESMLLDPPPSTPAISMPPRRDLLDTATLDTNLTSLLNLNGPPAAVDAYQAFPPFLSPGSPMNQDPPQQQVIIQDPSSPTPFTFRPSTQLSPLSLDPPPRLSLSPQSPTLSLSLPSPWSVRPPSDQVLSFSALANQGLQLAKNAVLGIRAGGGGGGGGAGGGGGQGINWDPHCRRNGNPLPAEVINHANQYPNYGTEQDEDIEFDRDALDGSQTADPLSDNGEWDAEAIEECAVPSWDKRFSLPPSDIMLSTPVPERQVLSQTAKSLIQRVALNFNTILAPDTSLTNPGPMLDFFTSIFSDHDHLQQQNDQLEGLSKAAHDCYMSEQKGNICFKYSMKIVNFRLWVHVESAAKGVFREVVLRDIKEKGGSAMASLSFTTLRKYVAEGTRLCLLTGAGSIFFTAALIWVATKAEVTDMNTTDAIRMAALVRCSDDSPEGKLIKESIIPDVDFFRRRLQFMLNTQFSPDVLWSFDCPRLVDGTNMFEMDILMDSLPFDCLIKGRNYKVWASCLVPLDHHRITTTYALPPQPLFSPPPLPSLPMPPSPERPITPPQPLLPPEPIYSPPPLPPSPPQPISSLSLTTHGPLEYFLIETQFDPTSNANKAVRFPRGDDKEKTKAKLAWTETERKRVNTHKIVPETLQELQEMVTMQLQSGRKMKYDANGVRIPGQADDAYIYIKNELLKKANVIRLNDKFQDLLALVCCALSAHISQRLLWPLQAVFGDKLINMDTFLDPSSRFWTLHFELYNRYAKQLKPEHFKAYRNADPAAYQMPGKKKVNSSQNSPRASVEIRDHPGKYGVLQQMLAPVFTWIDLTVEEHLPKVHEKLCEYVDCLPGNAIAVARPFSGFVINLNVMTQAHRDWHDDSICVVTVISDSDCVGGELVLVEPGLVLELKSGDMIIFPSSNFSHFNLHFKGVRASLVCHSDKYAASWVEGRNGWEYHTLYRGVRGKRGPKGTGKASANRNTNQGPNV